MAHHTTYWNLLTEGEYVISQVLNLVLEYVKFYIHPRHQDERNTKESVYTTYKDLVDVFIEGNQKSIDAERIKKLPDPEWLDLDMIRKGQQFAKNYYFTICYSNLISLYLLFTHDRSLRPLIYTNKSSEIETAYKRYVSTIHRVKSWYENDLTDANGQARKHIQIVNNHHTSISSRLNKMPEEEFQEKSNIAGDLIEDNYSRNRVIKVMNDNEIKIKEELVKSLDTAVHVSQTHMAVTQFGFMGLVVLYPEKFGIRDKEDLICFIHVWRYIGYLIGIEDKHNLCNGSYDEVVRKCRGVLECLMKPYMLDLSPYWEHMSICVCEGLNKIFKHLLFESTLAFLLDCMELRVDSFSKTMTFKSKLQLYTTKFIFYYITPINNIRNHLNVFLDARLEAVKTFS